MKMWLRMLRVGLLSVLLAVGSASVVSVGGCDDNDAEDTIEEIGDEVEDATD